MMSGDVNMLSFISFSFFSFFLVRLKQSQAASSSSLLKSPPRAVVSLRWGIRQPPSRSATLRCDSAVSRRKDADSTRCSPTTPLSWSGGASPSATARSKIISEKNRREICNGPPRFEGGSKFGDRDGYRGGPRGPPGEFGGEKGGAPLDFQPSYRPLPTYQYFENVQNFLVAIEELKFPGFEA